LLNASRTLRCVGECATVLRQPFSIDIRNHGIDP
jgi:hypothetical protein